MQINRLFEIIYILLDKQTVTARELAERFEVSSRTIYRDVETLSSAGIPIYMSKGKGGGISLLPDFVLNKAVLSEKEKHEILSALHGLNAVDSMSVNNTLAKMNSLFGSISTPNWIEIDYSDWGEMRRDQFETIKQAIFGKNIITFRYHNRNGESTDRTVEPITLWFKEKTWYLKAFCLTKQDFRLFKLTRMRNVAKTGESFVMRTIPQYEEAPDMPMQCTEITVRIDGSQGYRVFDDFDEKNIVRNDDGSFTATMHYVIDEWVYGYLLSFGSYAEVVAPPCVRDVIKERLTKSLEKYS